MADVILVAVQFTSTRIGLHQHPVIIGIATMAVGNIFETDHVNSIIAAGRADLCCLARPHLLDPNWTLRAGNFLSFPITARST